MSTLFSATEVVTMAVELEKNGMAFYNAMAAKTKSEKAKEVFVMLACEEVKHRDAFQSMLGNLSKLEMSPSEEEEYRGYMKALTGSRVFLSEADAGDIAGNIGNDLAAIDLAIQAEKDSILFYLELKEQVMPEDVADVDKVIKEEKSHLIRLNQLKESLS